MHYHCNANLTVSKEAVKYFFVKILIKECLSQEKEKNGQELYCLILVDMIRIIMICGYFQKKNICYLFMRNKLHFKIYFDLILSAHIVIEKNLQQNDNP